MLSFVGCSLVDFDQLILLVFPGRSPFPFCSVVPRSTFCVVLLVLLFDFDQQISLLIGPPISFSLMVVALVVLLFDFDQQISLLIGF